MRQQYDVVERHQFLRYLRLLRIDIETRRQDPPLLERLDQRGLVDHRAARHVDEDAFRAERVEHRGVDHVLRRRSARHDRQQNVDVAGHGDEVRIVLVRHTRLRIAAVVDDLHLKGFETTRDGLADPAHADETDSRVAQAGRRQPVALLQPFAGAQEPLGLRQLPHGAQQQPERGVGHLFVEHTRRVGHSDAVLAGPFGFDVVITDTEGRNDFEPRQPRHQGPGDPLGGGADRDRADARRKLRSKGIEILGNRRRVQIKGSGQCIHHQRLLRPKQQHVGLFASHHLRSADQSLAQALACTFVVESQV